MLRRFAAFGPLRAVYFIAIEAWVAWPRVGMATMMNDHHDAQYFNLYEEVARIAVTRFHQLPLWNPYYCGGIYQLATPSARFLSPTFLLTLAFGTFRANALIEFGMAVLGMEGAFRYARSRGASAVSAMIAAPIFAISGLFITSAALEWVNFFGFELVPWALLGIRMVMAGERMGIVLTAGSLGWMIGFGGTYTGPLTVISCAVEIFTVLAARARRRQWARIRESALLLIPAALLAVAASLGRLWPIAATLRASPRFIGGAGGDDVHALYEHLSGGWMSGFHKDNFVIGFLIFPLVAYGMTRRRALPVTFTAVLWLWLAMGYEANPSAFAALRHVPPYTMLRAPARFLTFFALAAVVIAAIGMRRVEVAARKRPAWLLVAVVGNLLLFGDAIGLGLNDRDVSARRKMAVAPLEIDQDFRQARGNRWLAIYYPFISRGSMACFDDYDIPQSGALRADLPQEEYLRDESAGTVHRVSWSPNEVRVHVELRKPARLYVNSNWHPGWRSDVGTVVSEDGLLAVDLPDGERDVTLRFKPRSAFGGLGATVLGLAGLVWLAYQARRRPIIEGRKDWAATMLIALAPFSAPLVALAFVREPPWPPAPLATPNGEAMLVDALPEDTHEVGARWERGITLLGDSIVVDKAPDGLPEATLELDWKLDAALPPGLGIFVKLERKGARVGADHVLLSSAVPFEALPAGTVIRDVGEPAVLPKSNEPTKWDIYVGVWWARGDGSRLNVDDPGRGTLEESRRVLVDSFEVP